MKIIKRDINNIVLLGLLLLYVILYRTVVLNSFIIYGESITCSVVILIFFLSVIMLGFAKNKLNSLRKSATLFVVFALIAFFSLAYIYGLFAGFLKNSYSLKLFSIINNSFFYLITVVFMELLKYNLIRANKDKKWVIVLTTIIIMLLDLALNIKKIKLFTFEYIFKLVTTLVIPIIIRNIVFSYLAYHIGYKPVLIYRLILEGYLFFVPIIPNFGDYINSMVGIILPISIFLYISRMIYEYENGVEKEFISQSFSIFDVPVYVFIIVFICLISRAFPYYITGIGSESMRKIINKGDAVIIFKEKDINKIKINDIVEYEYNGKRIIHRVIDIVDDNGINKYVTKGDSNNSIDNVDLTFDDINGKVCFKISFIAYPAVWLSELLD